MRKIKDYGLWVRLSKKDDKVISRNIGSDDAERINRKCGNTYAMRSFDYYKMTRNSDNLESTAQT